MYLGNIVEIMPGEDIEAKSLHPYTNALLASVFDINMDLDKKIDPIQGEVPSPLDVPSGCPFCDRCDKCMDICRKVKPELHEIENGHLVSCHLYTGDSSYPGG